MGGMGLIKSLVIGGLAGWLAGNIMKGNGFGVIGNVIVGIVGALVGSFTFTLLGLQADGFLGSLIMATVGAVILLWVVAMIKK